MMGTIQALRTDSLLNLEIEDWGRLDYEQALARQQSCVESRIAGSDPDRLVLVEHPPVVTIGRSGSLEDLCISEKTLRKQGISLHYVDRGGRATFHGPGQLVAYPIIKLRQKDLHWYVRTLLEVTADVLRVYRLEPTTKNGAPGIWVDNKKIASVGIAVRRWVTSHGIGLNVNTDPEWFRWIVPCGNPDEQITSMKQELGFALDPEEVKRHLVEAFCRVFEYAPRNNQKRRDSKRRPWLIRPEPLTSAIDSMERKLDTLKLATVCQSAQCPNLGECFERGTATFMILGTRCTRQCRFCAVEKGSPQEVDRDEPERIAQAAQLLGLRYVVVTSVTRDDLPDGGAVQFARTIREVRKRYSPVQIEILVPDFSGSLASIQKVCDARPDVLNHNLETVCRLYPPVRPKARYRRSLALLQYAARQGLKVKSGLMVGLGETPRELGETLQDLRRADVKYLTIGQYLAPSERHLPVAQYVKPEDFDQWKRTAYSMGFMGVAAGPFVRSSYRAHEMLMPAR